MSRSAKRKKAGEERREEKKERDGGRKRGNELRLVQILMWREAHE